jgi:hypothetical protein
MVTGAGCDQGRMILAAILFLVLDETFKYLLVALWSPPGQGKTFK